MTSIAGNMFRAYVWLHAVLLTFSDFDVRKHYFPIVFVPEVGKVTLKSKFDL